MTDPRRYRAPANLPSVPSKASCRNIPQDCICPAEPAFTQLAWFALLPAFRSRNLVFAHTQPFVSHRHAEVNCTNIYPTMRLTNDLINNSLSYLNPLKERELDLRGHKIPTLENLGVAGPQDAIDFTDNDITSITNFPLSPRLSTLLLARNRITNIQPNLFQSIPNLTTLVLSSNNVAELADLDPLRRFTRLTHLSLIENPVARKENYRLFLVWRIPSLRFLDFQKIKAMDRQQASELFGTETEPTELASKILGVKSRTFDAGVATNGRVPEKKTMRVKLTDSERKRVQALVAAAKSMQEISRIERELAEGRIPAGCEDGDTMET